MIKSDNGIVQIVGITSDILSDFTAVIGTMRKTLTEKFDEELADHFIACCGKLAIYNQENGGGAPPSDHAITKEFHQAQDEYLKRKLARESGHDDNK